jgi:hypothetical protein
MPVAVGVDASLHLAVGRDGSHAWVRRTRDPAAARASATDHRWAREIASSDDVVVPPVLDVVVEDVWIARPSWAEVPQPAPGLVDRYVEGSVTSALARATILALGEPHVATDGALIVEDAGIAARLERDECDLLSRVLLGIAHGAADEVMASVAGLGGPPPPALARAVGTGLASLAVEWSPVAFGLTLLQIGRATALMPGCAPLLLLASDVLQRLDLAHRHPRGLTALQSPGRVIDLVASARTTPWTCAAWPRPLGDAPLTSATAQGPLPGQHDRPPGR